MKAIIYGTGWAYANYKYMLPVELEIIAFMDSNENKCTSKTKCLFEGREIISLEELNGLVYDCIWICAKWKNANEMLYTLIKKGISSDKIFMLNRKCYEHLDWKYKPTEDNSGYISTVNGLTICEKTLTDSNVIGNVLVDREYDILVPYDNIVVIDAGMNVGFASLFFASQEHVKKVYSYEPFPDTWDYAMRNFELNDMKIVKKISAYNRALSDKDEVISVRINHPETGNRHIFLRSRNTQEECVTLKCLDVSKEFCRIFNENINSKFFLKMDIEGSEYPIFRRLDETNAFEKINVIAMEYHNYPTELVHILKRHNYIIKTEWAKQGILYAFK